jgi:hypothetical protein
MGCQGSPEYMRISCEGAAQKAVSNQRLMQGCSACPRDMLLHGRGARAQVGLGGAVMPAMHSGGVLPGA